MVVGDVMEELLRVKRTAQEKCEITISRFDNISNFVNSFPAVECIRVCEAVFDAICDRYAIAECLRDTG